MKKTCIPRFHTDDDLNLRRIFFRFHIDDLQQSINI